MTYKKLIIGILAITLVGCSQPSIEEPIVLDEQPPVEEPVVEETPVIDESSSAESDDATEKVVEEEVVVPEPEPVDYEALGVHEAGEIMIIMYHNLGDKNTTYGRSIESFKADIQRLYDMGFVTISLEDYANGYFDVPAGKTPVILTFDDGHPSNFTLLEGGEGEFTVDPNSVVGILEDFYEQHPEFGLEATFFLNGYPFGQADLIEYKLNYILDAGMDIGNHTFNHSSMPGISGDGLQKALGENVQYFKQFIPDYDMKFYALTNGQRPNDESLHPLLLSGQYEGTKYNHLGLLNVGWRPDYPPYRTNTKMHSLNRVQSGDGEFQLKYYLDDYEEKPYKRFISDGDPNTVVVPKRLEEKVNVELIGDKELIFYGEE